MRQDRMLGRIDISLSLSLPPSVSVLISRKNPPQLKTEKGSRQTRRPPTHTHETERGMGGRDEERWRKRECTWRDDPNDVVSRLSHQVDFRLDPPKPSRLIYSEAILQTVRSAVSICGVCSRSAVVDGRVDCGDGSQINFHPGERLPSSPTD
jgi:hypothetical protein